MTTMADLTGSPGFVAPRAGRMATRRRAIALEMIATGTLTISLIVAATAVSMGERSFARGHVAGPAGVQMPLPRQ